MFQNNNCKDYYDQTFEKIVYNDEISFKVFEECNFTDCNLSETVIKNCKFRDCKFINCNLSLITVAFSNFFNVCFRDCKMIGINWGYPDSLWSPTFLNCNISQSSFLGLKLKSISITCCIARDVDFRECDLNKSALTSNDFTNALFGNTNLINADFTNSTNYEINILKNKIKGAKFSWPEAAVLLHGIGIKIT